MIFLLMQNTHTPLQGILGLTKLTIKMKYQNGTKESDTNQL